jgi:hypothetical protein
MKGTERHALLSSTSDLHAIVAEDLLEDGFRFNPRQVHKPGHTDTFC